MQIAINVPINISLPSTPGEWDLYTNMNAHQLSEAVSRMNQAMVIACCAMARASLEGEHIPSADDAYEEHVRPVQEKYSHLGACDTEPRTIALTTLDEFRERVI